MSGTGANVEVAIKRETTRGTLATGNYVKVLLNSLGLEPSQDFLADPLIGQGRDAQQQARDVVNRTGDARVPVDLRNIGHWLCMIFGLPVTTGASAPYTHTFKTGAATLPSYSFEKKVTGAVAADQYWQDRGVHGNSLALSLAATGVASGTLGLIAMAGTRVGTSSAGTPTTHALQRFSQLNGFISRDGSAFGRCVGLDLTLTNNIEPDRYVGGAGAIEDVGFGQVDITGTLRQRVYDNVPFLWAENGTISDVIFGWQIDNNNKIEFEIEAAEIGIRGTPVQGPGFLQAEFPIRGFKDSSEGQSMTVRLINDVATY